MVEQRRALILLTGAAAMMLGGCELIFPSDQLRQRITVEVDTPEGVRRGSTVVETEVHKGKSWGDASGTQFKLHGEAVAIDLPGGRTLFALLRGSDAASGDPAIYQARLISDALRTGAMANETVAIEGLDLMAARRKIKAAEVRLDLPSQLYPSLVTLRDLNDPKTVERVDPTNLAASFGSGVTLRRITVQMTDDPVTTGIEKRLPWMDHLEKYRSDPENVFSSTLPQEIGALRHH